MKRELIRKKWEQEVQDALDKPVGPVHYQDILFNGEECINDVCLKLEMFTGLA
jgi:hypothetical protein